VLDNSKIHAFNSAKITLILWSFLALGVVGFWYFGAWNNGLAIPYWVLSLLLVAFMTNIAEAPISSVNKVAFTVAVLFTQFLFVMAWDLLIGDRLMPSIREGDLMYQGVVAVASTVCTIVTAGLVRHWIYEIMRPKTK